VLTCRRRGIRVAAPSFERNHEMPTGYTAAVNDGTITTLRDYALTCARAFGALIELRDDPLAKAPRRLPVEPSYHEQALIAAETELARLEALTSTEQAAGAQAFNTQNEIDRNAAIARDIAIRDRYDAMLTQVVQWQAPSPDHEELRKFMIDQLVESRRFDTDDEPGKYIPEAVTAEQWYADALKRAADNVTYHQQHLDADNQRAAERQAWLDKLWAALPTGEQP
jgi:hypothetical protein